MILSEYCGFKNVVVEEPWFDQFKNKYNCFVSNDHYEFFRKTKWNLEKKP